MNTFQLNALAGAGLILTGAMGAQAALNGAKSLIVPGKSIGQVQLGADLQTVYRRLGIPFDSDAAAGNLFDTWQSGKSKMVVHYIWDSKNARRRVVMNVRVTSPYFRTRSGVGVGSTWAQIRREFPSARSEPGLFPGPSTAQNIYTYSDTRRGILFDVARAKNVPEAQGRCVVVEVSSDMGD